MTTEITSCCDGLPSLRHFCHLSGFAVRDVRNCHSPFPVTCFAFCANVCWFKANQSVCTREMSLVCFLTKNKRELIETILVNHHLPDLLSVTIQRRERIVTVLWVLVLCLLYFVTYGLHRKYMSTSTKWWRSAWLNCKEEDLVVHKIPLECVLFENFNNVNDE